MGAQFHSAGPCKDAGYILQILGQADDDKMSTLKALEGSFAKQLPECFQEGGNKRMEGQEIRKRRRKKTSSGPVKINKTEKKSEE